MIINDRRRAIELLSYDHYGLPAFSSPGDVDLPPKKGLIMLPKPGQSTRNGLWRIRYDPAWSKLYPYVVYHNGDTLRRVADLSRAQRGISTGYHWTEWA